MRQGSASSLLRQQRPSDSQSTLSVTEGKRRSADDGDSSSRLSGGSIGANSGELRKAKSSLFSRLRTHSSKGRLRQDSSEHPSLRQPAPPLPDQFGFITAPGHAPSVSSMSSTSTVFWKSERSKKKGASSDEANQFAESQMGEPEFRIDTNFDEMDGIIDSSIVSNPGSLTNGPSSPSSGFDSSTISDHSTYYVHYGKPPLTSSDFSNPFLPTPVASKRRGMVKVSPTTKLPSGYRPLPPSPMASGPGSPSWTAPESWAVVPGEEDPPEEYSGSEDSVAEGTAAGRPHKHRSQLAPVVNPPKRVKRKQDPPYKIRIYRANNTYHVAAIGFQVNVASLTPALNEKLLLGEDRETHRLYLKERGRGEHYTAHLDGHN